MCFGWSLTCEQRTCETRVSVSCKERTWHVFLYVMVLHQKWMLPEREWFAEIVQCGGSWSVRKFYIGSCSHASAHSAIVPMHYHPFLRVQEHLTFMHLKIQPTYKFLPCYSIQLTSTCSYKPDTFLHSIQSLIHQCVISRDLCTG